jgi:hypothetical protein
MPADRAGVVCRDDKSPGRGEHDVKRLRRESRTDLGCFAAIGPSSILQEEQRELARIAIAALVLPGCRKL